MKRANKKTKRQKQPFKQLKQLDWLLVAVGLVVAGLGVYYLTNSQAAAGDIYQAQNGTVIMEVESTPPVEDWKLETSFAGYTGTGYYTWRGPNLANSPGQGVLTYKFNVAQAGEYFVYVRKYHTHEDTTKQNDFFARMDGGEWIKSFDWTKNLWEWVTTYKKDDIEYVPLSFQLTAGVHTFEIAARGDALSIDRIAITNTAGSGQDTTLPESPTGTTPPPPNPPPTNPPPTNPPPTNPPPPNPNPKPGDLNGDNQVNITDVSIMLSSWGQGGVPADLNGSGKVDITDLSTLLSNWGK
jgi:hypothetical protein